MATTEERMKILQMIQEGKISAEDGAKLLSALTNSAARNKPRRPGTNLTPRRGAAKWLRVRVTDMRTGKSKVNVNLPISLLEAGMSIAGHFADDINVDDIMTAISDAIDENMTGKIIDVVDGEDGEHVEIFID
ncbi:MAG TPA: hypothetical protein PK530_18605 [Anaerolineales bacterium]|nr:hypothetical protein [Anaerolineales bacterium]